MNLELIQGKKSKRWLALCYRTAGVNFGTVALLRDGKRVVAETEVVPLHFNQAARGLALKLAETL